MGKDNLTYDDLIEIVQLIESSSRFSEFRLKTGDLEIELRAKIDGNPAQPAGGEPVSPGPVQTGAAAEIAVAHAPPVSPPQFAEGLVLVRAPMVGTFYRAPEPGVAPFVTVGSRVEPETTVCIIEVMKLMSSIAAGHYGVVTRILVDDARLVEAAQVLMVIDPEA